jgi:hypothetical protein
LGYNTYIHGNVTRKLCSYLKQIEMSSFPLFYKIGEQEGRTGPVRGIGTSGSGKEVGKECQRVNIVQIVCTHVCRWKKGAC